MIHPYQSKSLLSKIHQTCNEQTGDLHEHVSWVWPVSISKDALFLILGPINLFYIDCPFQKCYPNPAGCQLWKAQEKVALIHKQLLGIPFLQQVKIGLTRAIKTNKVQLALYLTQLETIRKNLSPQKSVRVFSIVNSRWVWEHNPHNSSLFSVTPKQSVGWFHLSSKLLQQCANI